MVINCVNGLSFGGNVESFLGLKRHSDKEKRTKNFKFGTEANKILRDWTPYSKLTSLAELFEVSKNLDVLNNAPSKTYVKVVMKYLLKKNTKYDKLEELNKGGILSNR